jgi:glucokinase
MPTHTDSTEYVIGVDLGGTNIVCGAMPTDGSREIAMRSQPTYSEQGAETVVDRIVQMIEDVISVTRAETGATRERRGSWQEAMTRLFWLPSHLAIAIIYAPM